MIESAPRRMRLLFVGGFTLGSDGLTGGAYVACSQLMSSPLAAMIDIATVDVSQPDEKSRKIAHRALSGVARLLRVVGLVISRRIDTALIFATIGPSWYERGLMAIICRLGGVRCFLFPRCADLNGEIAGNRATLLLTKLVAALGTEFIFQGKTIEDGFLAIIPAARSRTHVIGNWIELTWQENVPPPAAVGDTVNVLYMGWLHPLKGADVLIEGLARSREKFTDCRFVLCGDGSERPALEAAAAKSGVNVEFRGWVHDAQKLAAFAESDIVVLPSRTEGMPNVLLEAMSVGRPVVATKVGSVPDLVEDGVEGLLVPSEDPDAFAAAILRLADDRALRLRLGAAGRQKIERDHDLKTTWRRLANLLTADFDRIHGRRESIPGNAGPPGQAEKA